MKMLKPGRLAYSLCWPPMLLCLTACQPQTSPEQQTIQPEPTPTSVAAPLAAQPRVLDGLTWTYETDGRCVATASNKAVAVSVETTDTKVEWRIHGRPIRQMSTQSSTTMRFSTSNAVWTTPTRRTSTSQLVASGPLSENQVAHILAVMEGAAVSVGTGGDTTTVKVPPAGQEGAKWFRCVREHLLP